MAERKCIDFFRKGPAELSPPPIWKDFSPKHKQVRRPLSRTHRPSNSLPFTSPFVALKSIQYTYSSVSTETARCVWNNKTLTCEAGHEPPNHELWRHVLVFKIHTRCHRRCNDHRLMFDLPTRVQGENGIIYLLITREKF